MTTIAPPPTTRAAAQAKVPRPPSRTRTVLVALAYVVVPLVVLTAVWEAATRLGDSPFFPPPSAIIGHTWELLFSGPTLVTDVFREDFLPTLGRLVLGFVLGTVWGIVIGTAMGLSRATRETVTPIVELLRSIPATATLPLFIILLGGGDDMRVIFIAYGVSWFVLINTASGVGTIHKTLLDLGQVFKVSPARRLFTIILPAALPKIFAGVRIASTAALLLAIVSEFMLATNGIGFQLVQAQGRFQMLTMWSWMLVLAVMGLVINLLFDLLEMLLLSWHRLSRAKI
ncbi:Alkanesulfonates transport system permease protein [Actinomycetales bacterium JB111]|nr:Alkanesulfonates transport system permease protein [Actinomycetales bacterium JB111]